MIARKVERTASQLGIGELLDRQPAELSAGERSRAALARAIVSRAAVLLLDEPLANLDPPRRVEMRAHLKSLLASLRTTTILVTHDHAEAMALGDRIAVLHQGRVAQIGKPAQVYGQPANQQVASFLGGMNFLSGRLVETEAAEIEFVAERSGVRLKLPASLRGRLRPGAITLGLRREQLRLEQVQLEQVETVSLAGVVRSVEWQGDAVLARIQVVGKYEDGCGDEIEARFSAGQSLRAGERIELRIDLKDACWFDTATGKNVLHPDGAERN